MGLCGCFGTCDCILEGAGQVSITGSGDVSDPYIITGGETPFDLTSLSQALVVTAGGSDGHLPSIDLVIDPASQAPVSVGPAGLKIDCCPGGATDVSEIACNNITVEFDGLYADAGWTTLDAGTAIDVSIPVAGGTSSDSWTRTVNNNEDCAVILAVRGNPFVDWEASVGGVDTELEFSVRLNSVGAAFVGGGTQRSTRMAYQIPGSMIAAGEDHPWITTMGDFVVIPAGGSTVLSSVIVTTRRANVVGNTASGRGFNFQTPTIMAARVRATDLDVVPS